MVSNESVSVHWWMPSQQNKQDEVLLSRLTPELQSPGSAWMSTMLRDHLHNTSDLLNSIVNGILCIVIGFIEAYVFMFYCTYLHTEIDNNHFTNLAVL